ncbi:MAG: hypothetical protein GIX03_02225 [Candidatus Eremiobacteraeota bacterium]|nr:hypothetical protein [Candidatus Eremiobacteraeota bacterium]MBC5801834.1 hypothetical protein [Candidatus Eremiobacteraeota bacterium]MBC5822100.1 hypothetical protein [Candidatus Eremiobacteraeota bacterium]
MLRLDTVLRAVGATFEDRRDGLIGPYDFTLREGQALVLAAASPRAASIAARMFGAIVKPTAGTIYVDEYDTRLQPPEAKRRLGFVDAGGFTRNAHAFDCEVAFRADVWNLDRAGSRQRAYAVLASLATFDDAWARAIALALVANVDLIVLDQPCASAADAIRRVAPAIAIVETRVARALPFVSSVPVPAPA